jgi:hypothetical protein
MDEVIWVEVLSRHRELVARHRCDGPEIRIGRSYANDVIVDDPHVAPEHVRIRRDPDGAIVAEDLGSANGMFADRGSRRLERLVLDGTHPIRIGHTFIQVRDARQAVAPERVIGAQARTWPILLALGAAILGLELLSVWLHETAEPKLSRYVEQPLGIIVVALGWTTGWAILTRIFSGRARFERTLLIALSGMLAFSLYNEVSAFAGFALVWRALATYQYVGMWLILAAVCFLHLREISRARPVLKGGLVAAFAGLAIAVHTLAQSEQRAGGEPRSAANLMPPAFRLSPLQTETAFFADVERLKSKLDKARTEDPP